MFTIQELAVKDIPQVISLSARIFDPILHGLDKDEDKNIWWQNFENNGILLGAYGENELVGFIFFFEKEKATQTIHCWMAGVEEEFRGQGILTMLINKGLTIAKGKGFKSVTVNTIKEKNPQMYSYLMKHAFEEYKQEAKDWHGETTTKCYFKKNL